tara:strand:+ start:2371 stop:2709 length:339 start_codon:yes stop_codon:yes gene_type:complete
MVDLISEYCDRNPEGCGVAQDIEDNVEVDEDGKRTISSDSIAELADSNIPIYYSDLLKAAMEDTSLGMEVEDSGMLGDPSDITAYKIIQTNIYERNFQAAYEYCEKADIEIV